jgi:leucyl aminopeptidase
MLTGFNKDNWKTLLPDTYQWSFKVELKSSDQSVAGAVHLVTLAESKSDDKDAKDTIALNAPHIPDAQKTKIVQALNTAGWRGSAPMAVVVDQVTYLVAGPCKVKTTKPQRSRQQGLAFASALKNLKYSSLVVCKGEDICSKSLIDGLAMGFYNCQSFKGPKKDKDEAGLPKTISLWGGSLDKDKEKSLRAMMAATALTRFIQDAPANWFDPARFAEVASDVCKDLGIKVKVHKRAELEALGMGSFLSVNNGSAVEAHMIVMEIDGEDNSKTAALVGKGLTFDAGGVSLKPGAGMEEMKYDMSGGAAVLGSAVYFSQVKPPVKTVCIIGATENLINSKATKPGDIVVAMNGKTIEVQNTDAEGRLVLADLVHYANVTYKPEMMIDIATLTGAVLIALGTVGAGLMSNDDATAQHVLKASQETGEPFWQLPMWPELEAETKGSTADLNNIAKPSVKAGTIMGAMFIKEFVGSAKWVHLDIAGTGWNCKATGFPGSGGCAYGLRTMVQAVKTLNR